jgi:murein DD-endopeptidase MepM/ murein hydrolase activator NlpD
VKSLGPLTAAVLVAACLPAAALAATTPPTISSPAGGAVYGVTYPGPNGGTAYGSPVPVAPKPKTKPQQPKRTQPKNRPSSPAARPALQAFSVRPAILTPGQTPTVSFTVKGRAPTIRLRLIVTWPGTKHRARRIDLGRVPANSAQTLPLPALADPTLPEGNVSVRITGRDSAGRILRPGARLSRVTEIQVRGHLFPLRGTFSYGTADDRFGAKRDGHKHQGQDLLAADGVPVVAPRSGTIVYVGYQASAAGYYVVLDGDNEDLNYVFMHLQKDSIPVVAGQHVNMGDRLGSVGHSGDAQGSHLHFEIWQGPWYNGGHAIDPLPYLQQWQQWSPVTAT